jgi:hypothetical protein
MNNVNKWIPVSQAYPPDGATVEAMIDGKVCNVIFNDYEHCRGWTIKKEEYDGFLLPTAWRFPEGTISIVLKVDLENETSEELGI